MKKVFYMVAVAMMVFIGAVQAADLGDHSVFHHWVDQFKAHARMQGVSEQTLSAAFADIRYLPRVIELDRKQPESKITFEKYKGNIVSAQRIKQGRAEYAKHRKLLDEIGAAYGVQPQYIVALWGIETNFGSNTGGFSVIESLATLAYEGRRKEFFSNELVNALKIIDQGHITAEAMKGSWAGAMGQSQFMPSSFLKFAQDYNRDGHKDIWNTPADVFASAANYLAQTGWKADQRWGREVKVPASVPDDAFDRMNKKPLAEWARLGVTLPNGSPLPAVMGMQAGLVAPDGRGGAKYLTYGNYDVIMDWNRSTFFATSVGLLADQIALKQ